MKTMVAQRAQVKVCDTPEELATESANEFVRIINGAITKNGQATVALSGGSTPHLLYKKLVSKDYVKKVDWSKVHFFVSDERCVPLESHESNFGNAQREFLDQIKLPEENLHPPHHQDASPAEAALAYENDIKQFFELDEDAFPRFDLLLLGMGPDGHCASLFPNTKALKEMNRIVVENRVDSLQAMRITFTFPTINCAYNVIFMVQGHEKSYVLGEVLMGHIISFPVQHVTPVDGDLQWILDKSAADDFLKTEAGSR